METINLLCAVDGYSIFEVIKTNQETFDYVHEYLHDRQMASGSVVLEEFEFTLSGNTYAVNALLVNDSGKTILEIKRQFETACVSAVSHYELE